VPDLDYRGASLLEQAYDLLRRVMRACKGVVRFEARQHVKQVDELTDSASVHAGNDFRKRFVTPTLAFA
jgi:hypothetical protein